MDCRRIQECSLIGKENLQIIGSQEGISIRPLVLSMFVCVLFYVCIDLGKKYNPNTQGVSISKITVSRDYICHWGNFVANLPVGKRSVKEELLKRKENFRNIGSIFIPVINLTETGPELRNSALPSKAHCPKRVNWKVIVLERYEHFWYHSPLSSILSAIHNSCDIYDERF